jgi:hypothetical protein
VTTYDDEESVVFGANEQNDVDIDVSRYVRLARLVLEAERVLSDVEMSLLFVDEPTIAELNERFLGYEGPTGANPTRVAAAPGRPPTLATRPRCSATSWSARRSRAGRRPSAARASTTRSPSSWSTVCCTC